MSNNARECFCGKCTYCLGLRVEELSSMLESTTADLRRLIALIGPYSTVDIAAKELERLIKLEIPNLKIERDGAKYESDMFEKRWKESVLQVRDLRLAGQRARGQLREVLKLGMFAPESSAHVYAAHEALEPFDVTETRHDEPERKSKYECLHGEKSICSICWIDKGVNGGR